MLRLRTQSKSQRALTLNVPKMKPSLIGEIETPIVIKAENVMAAV